MHIWVMCNAKIPDAFTPCGQWCGSDATQYQIIGENHFI